MSFNSYEAGSTNDCLTLVSDFFYYDKTKKNAVCYLNDRNKNSAGTELFIIFHLLIFLV